MDRSAARSSGLTQAMLAAPSFAASLVVTELFFKWGSFMLELCGFAAVWGALYGFQYGVMRLFGKK